MKKCLLDKIFVLSIFVLGVFSVVNAQQIRPVTYPYAVKFLNLQIEGKPAQMAYMDAKAKNANGQNVILFHGKNFNGYYWKDVAKSLTDSGFRVIIPDQIGWGKSSKPHISYSFHLLSANSKKTSRSIEHQEDNCYRAFNRRNAGDAVCVDVSRNHGKIGFGKSYRIRGLPHVCALCTF